MKFQIGDRVLCIINGGGDRACHGPRAGQAGEIILRDPRNNTLPYCVAFDQPVVEIFRASCQEITHVCRWWCSESALELIDSEDAIPGELNLEEVL